MNQSSQDFEYMLNVEAVLRLFVSGVSDFSIQLQI